MIIIQNGYDCEYELALFENMFFGKNEDGTYLIQIGIFRLTFLRECTGILVEDKIVFSTTEWGEDKEITGTITVDDEDIATVTLEAAWSDWWFKNINVYKYYKVSDVPDIYELQY